MCQLRLLKFDKLMNILSFATMTGNRRLPDVEDMKKVKSAMSLTRNLVLAALSLVSTRAFSDAITRETAEAAARGFLAKSGFARQVLAGRSVGSVEARGSLWVVNLSPGGHIILSGSDRMAPIHSFSSCDFVEPAEDSPEFAMLAAHETAQAEMESDESAAANPEWASLTSSAARRMRLMADSPSGDDYSGYLDYVPPLLGAAWYQFAPYNNLTPRRCPCGCMAIAGGMEFRYWRWPYRMEVNRQYTHNLSGYGPVTLRENGSVPINWDLIHGYYNNESAFSSSGDMRRSCYETANLIMWMQSFVHMGFGPGGSGGTQKLAGQPPFYKNGGMPANKYRDGYDRMWTAITNDIAFGSPIQVNTPGHQMVADGYAVEVVDGVEKNWLNINYGYANAIKWVNIKDDTAYENEKLADFQVGFRPKKMVQLEPLPVYSQDEVTLAWHLPWCYTNKVSGFSVVVSKEGEATAATNVVSDVEARSWTTNGLENAATYRFAVSPIMSDGSEADTDEANLYVRTTIDTVRPHPLPEIYGVSVVGAGLELLQDGFFAECGIGITNAIVVTCSEATTGLQALPSHLTMLPDERVGVVANGNGVFTVNVDATAMSTYWAGDMMVMTLVASNADGTEASKNLMLRFNTTRQVLDGTFDVVADGEAFDSAWFCGRDTVLDAKGRSLTFKAGAFMGTGNVTLADTTGGGSFSFEDLSLFSGTLAWGGITVHLPETEYACTLKLTADATISEDIPETATLNVASGATVTLDGAGIGTLTGAGTILASSGASSIGNISGFDGSIELDGGALTVHSGVEGAVSMYDGTLTIRLDKEQTMFGYSAVLGEYGGGTVQFEDYDGTIVAAVHSGAEFARPETANTWTSGESDNYNASSNWSQGRVPGSGDYVIFNAGNGATMRISDLGADVSLGVVCIKGEGPLSIVHEGEDLHTLSADKVINGVATTLCTSRFQPAAIEPSADFIIGAGAVLSCEVDSAKSAHVKKPVGGSLAGALTDVEKWHGTVCFRGIDLNDYNYNDYGNVNSAVRITGGKGYFGSNGDNVYDGPALELKDDGDTPAILWNNGWGGNQRTQTFRALTGDGTLKTEGSGAGEKILVNDIGGFFGSFDLNAKSLAIGSLMPYETSHNGRFLVCNGFVATNTTGKTWHVRDGVYVAGELTVLGELETSIVYGYGQGGVLNLADGGLIEVDSIPGDDTAIARNYYAGTFRVTSDASEKHAVNFCAAEGTHTTLDANGHTLTFSATAVRGSGAIHPVSSVAGGSVVFLGLDSFSGTLIIDDTAAVTLPDDLSGSPATIELSTELTLPAGREGNVVVKQGGTLKLRLSAAQILYHGCQRGNVEVQDGGTLQYVDPHGVVVDGWTGEAQPGYSGLSVPVATAVWETGEFAKTNNGYCITLNDGNSISGGNLLVGSTATNGVTIRIDDVMGNVRDVSVLVKYSNAIAPGERAVFACAYAYMFDNGLVTTDANAGTLKGYYNKTPNYPLRLNGSEVYPDPTSSSSGTFLFAYDDGAGLYGYNGTDVSSMSGGWNSDLHWSNQNLKTVAIGGPSGRIADTYAVWPNLVIEKVALFVGRAYSADEMCDFVWPSERYVGDEFNYTRSLSGDADWAAADSWTKGSESASWSDSLLAEAVVEVTADTTLSLPSTIVAKKLVFNIGEGVTLTLAAAADDSGSGVTAKDGLVANGGTLVLSGQLVVPAISGSSALRVADGSQLWGPVDIAARDIPSVAFGSDVIAQTIRVTDCPDIAFGDGMSSDTISLAVKGGSTVTFGSGVTASSIAVSADVGGVTLAGNRPSAPLDHSGVVGQVVYAWPCNEDVISRAGGLKLAGGAGAPGSPVSFTPVGGSMAFDGRGGAPYFLSLNTETNYVGTAISFTDAAVSTENFQFGEATVTVGGNSSIFAEKVTLSQDAPGRTTYLTLKDNAALTVTSTNNVDVNTASIMFGHWEGDSSFTLQGAALFNAEGIDVLVGKTRGDHAINIQGGTFAVNGVKLSAYATGRNSLSLSGGEMKLGETGISSYDEGCTMQVSVSGNSRISTATPSTTVPVTQAVTLADGATLTLDGGGTVNFTTLDMGANSTLVLVNGTTCFLGGGAVSESAKFKFASGTALCIEDDVVCWGSRRFNLTDDSETPSVTVYEKGMAGTVASTASVESGVLSIDWNPSTTGRTCWFDYEFNGNYDSIGRQTTPLTASTSIQYYDSRYLYAKSVPWVDGDANYPDSWSASIRCTVPKGENVLVVAFGTLHDGILGLAAGAPSDGEYNTMNIVRTTGSSVHSVVGSVTIPNASTTMHTYFFVKTPEGVSICCDGGKVFPTGLETAEALDALRNLSFGNEFQIGSIHGGIDNTGLYRVDSLDASVRDDCKVDFLRLYDFAIPEGHGLMNATWEENPLYTRTVSYDGAWTDDGAWTKHSAFATWTDSAVASAVVNVTNDVTLVLPSSLTAEHLLFNIRDGVTLTLSAADGGTAVTVVEGLVANGGTLALAGTFSLPVMTGSSAVKVADGQTLALGSNLTVPGGLAVGANATLYPKTYSIPTVSGGSSATVVYEDRLPQSGAGWTNPSEWLGTVAITTTTGSAVAVAGLNLNDYGNANSTVRLSGLAGYLKTSTDFSVNVQLEVEDNGSLPGFDYDNGNANDYIKLAGLMGDGTFKVWNRGNGGQLYVGEIDRFCGDLNMQAKQIYVGGDAPESNPNTSGKGGKIFLQTNATIVAGHAWTAKGGITVSGELTVNGDLYASAIYRQEGGSVVGGGNIYLMPGSAATFEGLDGFAGKIVVEGAVSATQVDDMSASSAVVELSGGASLACESGKDGNITVKDGGTLTIRLTDDEAAMGYTAAGLTIESGGRVNFTDAGGTVVATITSGNSFAGVWSGAVSGNHVISLNVCNAEGNLEHGYVTNSPAVLLGSMVGSIPGSAWQNFGWQLDANNHHAGSLTGVAAWNGTTNVVLGDVVVTYGTAEVAYWMGNLYYEISNPAYQYLKCYYGRKNGGSIEGIDITVSNIPYARYDAIVYLSAKSDTSTAGASIGVNGTSYYGGQATEANPYGTYRGTSSSWGSPNDVSSLRYGGNVLRILDLESSTLSITIDSAAGWGVSAVQIVEVETPIFAADGGALDFADASKWSTGEVPENGRSVVIDVNADTTLAVDAAKTFGNVTIAGDSGPRRLALSGAAAITAESVSVGAGVTLAATPANLVSPVDLATATSALEIADSCTWSQVVSGLGGVYAAPNSAVAFTAVNTFSGGMMVSGGASVSTTANQDSVGTGFGADGSSIFVAGTLDLANTANNSYALTLIGGSVTNSGSAIGTWSKQVSSISLSTADSTVCVPEGKDYGILAPAYGPSWLALGPSLTLSKAGNGTFFLFNTAITGSGTLAVEEGKVELHVGDHSAIGDNVTVAVGANGTLDLATLRPSAATFDFASGANILLDESSDDNGRIDLTVAAGSAVPAISLRGTSSGDAPMKVSISGTTLVIFYGPYEASVSDDGLSWDDIAWNGSRPWENDSQDVVELSVADDAALTLPAVLTAKSVAITIEPGKSLTLFPAPGGTTLAVESGIVVGGGGDLVIGDGLYVPALAFSGSGKLTIGEGATVVAGGTLSHTGGTELMAGATLSTTKTYGYGAGYNGSSVVFVGTPTSRVIYTGLGSAGARANAESVHAAFADADNWKGVFELRNVFMKNIDFASYGNTNSTVCANGVEGYPIFNGTLLGSDTKSQDIANVGTLDIGPGGLTFGDKLHSQLFVISAAVTGDGDIVVGTESNSGNISQFAFVGGMDGFAGNLGFGTLAGNAGMVCIADSVESLPARTGHGTSADHGRIFIGAGESIAIAAGKEWKTPGNGTNGGWTVAGALSSEDAIDLSSVVLASKDATVTVPSSASAATPALSAALVAEHCILGIADDGEVAVYGVAKVAQDSNGGLYCTIADALAAIEADQASDSLVLTTTVALVHDTDEPVVLPQGYALSVGSFAYGGTVSGVSGTGIVYDGESGTYTSVSQAAATWTGLAGDGMWSNPQNWSSGLVPTAETTVTFDGDAVVKISGNNEVGAIVANGVVEFRDPDLNYDNYPAIVLMDGGISGTGAVRLNRSGLKNGSGGIAVVACDVEFCNDSTAAVGSGSSHDSFIQGSNFVFERGVTGTGLLRVIAAATFNGAVVVPEGAFVRFESQPVFGEHSLLSGSGKVTLSGIAATDKVKEFLSDSANWTGTCELSAVTLDDWDLSGYGNARSSIVLLSLALGSDANLVVSNGATCIVSGCTIDDAASVAVDSGRIDIGTVRTGATFAFAAGSKLDLTASSADTEGVVTLNVAGGSSVPEVTIYDSDGNELVGHAASISGNVLTIASAAGKACWIDYEFNGNGRSIGTDTTGLTFSDGTDYYDGQCIYVYDKPWRNVAYPEDGVWSAVARFTNPETAGTIIVTFGSTVTTPSGYIGFVSGGPGTVKFVARSNGGSIEKNLCSIDISSAPNAPHVYAIVKTSSSVKVYCDGVEKYSAADKAITIGAGLQLGSMHGGSDNTGGNNYEWKDAADTERVDGTPARMDFLRMYKSELDQSAIQAIADGFAVDATTYSTVIVGGEVEFDDLAWNYGAFSEWPNDCRTKMVVVAMDDAVLNLPEKLYAYDITLAVAPNKTLTLNAAPGGSSVLADAGITIGGESLTGSMRLNGVFTLPKVSGGVSGATLEIASESSAVTALGKVDVDVKGCGTIAYNRFMPKSGSGTSWTDGSAWTGTVWIKTREVKPLDLDLYGNTNSTVKLTNVAGYLRMAKYTVNPEVEVEGSGFNFNNGSSNDRITIRRLKGSGTFKTTNSGGNGGAIHVIDTDGFTGELSFTQKVIIIGDADYDIITDSVPDGRGGKVIVREGTHAVASRPWSANGGFVIDGEVSLASANAYLTGSVLGSGVVKADYVHDGGALRVPSFGDASENTYELAGMASGWISNARGNGMPNVKAVLKLSGDVRISNGYGSDDLSGNMSTYRCLTGSGNLTFDFSTGSSYANYTIATVNGATKSSDAYTGTIAIGVAKDMLTIGAVDVDSVPFNGECVVALGSANRGNVRNAAGVSISANDPAGFVDVTVNGEASGAKLFLGDGGLYAAVASVAADEAATNYYASLSSAIAAVGGGVVMLMADIGEPVVIPPGETVRIANGGFSCSVAAPEGYVLHEVQGVDWTSYTAMATGIVDENGESAGTVAWDGEAGAFVASVSPTGNAVSLADMVSFITVYVTSNDFGVITAPGVPAGNVAVKCGDVDTTAAYDISKNGDVFVFGVNKSGNAAVRVGDEYVMVRPELDLDGGVENAKPFDVEGDGASFRVKTIPGLWYAIEYGTLLENGGIGGTAGTTEATQAAGATTVLEAVRPSASTGFYRVIVSPGPTP